MASKKHNWAAIKKDFYDKKYATLKELAEAHDIKYTYLRQKTAKWAKESPEFISDLDVEEAQLAIDIPENRKEKVRLMYDKLSVIALRALSDPENNFFTVEGKLKSKAFLDVASVVEKIQKGYETGEDGKQTGQLGEYAAYIKQLRKDNGLDDTKATNSLGEE